MTIAFVGSDEGNTNFSASAASSTYSPTTGNLCIIIGTLYNSASLLTMTFSDTRGNTATLVASADDASGPRNINVWTVPITTGGSGTFKVTASANPDLFVAITVHEFSGCDSGGALDGTPVAGVHSSATSISQGSVTLANSNSLLLSSSAYVTTPGSTVTNTLSGGTQYQLIANDGGQGFESTYYIGLTAGAQTNTKTTTNSVQSLTSLIGIKAGSANILLGAYCL